MTCNTFNNQTAKYSVSALTQEQLNTQLYSFEQLYNMQLDPSLQYDQELIYSTVSLTKSTLAVVDPSGTLYPLVWDRFTQGPILAPEYADFLNFSQYDLTEVNNILNSFPITPPITVTQYFEQLDLYYNNNFAATLSGGFCSAFSGKLLALSGLISGAVSLINQLKNFSLGDIISRLSSIKNILLQLVDSLKTKLLQQITNIVNKMNNFANMIASTAAAIGRKIQQAKNFFSDLNIANIKTKIEEIIARMAGGYEEITADVIAYILFRLCRLTEILNAFMRSPVDALKGIMNNFAYQQILFSNFSLNATAAAVAAGHYRKDPLEVIAERNAAAQAGNNSGMSAYVSRPFSSAEIQMANELRSATIEQINSNSFAAATYISFDTLNKDEAPYSWQKVDLDVWIRLFRISERLNTRFSILSAWRSTAKQQRLYDAEVAKSGPSQTKVAKPGGSLHEFGGALDVVMSGRSDSFRVNFIRAASEEGFNGIGTYTDFIHVDNRSDVHTWGSYNTDALALHKNKTYRQAIYGPQ